MTKNILMAIVCAVLAAYATVKLTPSHSDAAKGAYERVIHSNTLRCGYGIFPPMIVKDPNTGEIRGIFADIMRAIGDAAELKIEFVEEVDWGQIPQALQSGRIDAMCAGMWGTAKRAKLIAFTDPLFYSVVYPYVRADDRRFDDNLAAIDDPDVSLAVNDGDVSLDIAKRWFPKAKRVYKVQMAGEDFLLMNVLTRKADVTFTTPSIAKDFMRNNPNSLRQVMSKKPLAVNGNVIGVDIREQELQDLLNAAVKEIHDNGVIGKIFTTYDAATTSDFLLTMPQ